MNQGFRFVAVFLFTLVFALSGATALAQEGTPEAVEGDGMPALFPDTCSVVAEGLNDPRYLVVSEDGTVFVTEAGNGGDDVGFPPPSAEGTPGEGTAVAEGEQEPIYVRGASGQVTMIAPDGTQSVLAGGLPSYGGVGPAGIVDTGDTLWVSIGGGAAGTAFFASLEGVALEIEPLEFENSIIKIDKASGESLTRRRTGLLRGRQQPRRH